MRAGNQAGRGRRLALYIVAALAAVVVLGTSLGLMGYIDQKLKQGAEQQVVTFTQQAASNVTDRIFIVQNAIGAFEVQSADPAAVVPALPVRLRGGRVLGQGRPRGPLGRHAVLRRGYGPA